MSGIQISPRFEYHLLVSNDTLKVKSANCKGVLKVIVIMTLQYFEHTANLVYSGDPNPGHTNTVF